MPSCLYVDIQKGGSQHNIGRAVDKIDKYGRKIIDELRDKIICVAWKITIRCPFHSYNL